MLDKLAFPNVRKVFVADPGYILFEADLKGADAQVVAWEADDEDLKAAFRAGLDVHAKNAEDLFGREFTSLSKDDPARKRFRDKTKRSVHAANYLVSPATLAANANMLVIEAEKFIKRWFSIHPKIKENFHGKIEASLATTRSVSNSFGYKVTYFDRLEQCMTNAVAWIPQSTVALVTTYGAVKVRKVFPGIFNLQVHDSLIFQLRMDKVKAQLPLIADYLRVQVPYSDPLYIPWELKCSSTSWGDCKPCDWTGKVLDKN